jgi:hypothetical protein
MSHLSRKMTCKPEGVALRQNRRQNKVLNISVSFLSFWVKKRIKLEPNDFQFRSPTENCKRDSQLPIPGGINDCQPITTNIWVRVSISGSTGAARVQPERVSISVSGDGA